MAIQSSINSLLSQAQSLAAFYKGFEKAGDFIKGQDDIIKGQEAQTEATKNLQKTFEERFRKEFNIDSKTPLNKEQKRAIEWGMVQEKRTGGIVEPSRALRAAKVFEHMDQIREERRKFILESQREVPAVKNEIASDLARGSVEARTNSINQAKADFNAHTASLIKKYGKGSENP